MASSISLRIGQAIVLGAAHTYQDRYYKPCRGPHIIRMQYITIGIIPNGQHGAFYPWLFSFQELALLDVELQIEALVLHVPHALNITRSSLALLLDEVT